MGYSPAITERVSPPKNNHSGSVYCLEVEGNHNFLSADMVLSNCTATNVGLANRGARILWADVDPRTGLIDPDDVRWLCKEHDVTAIIGVDWAGASCEYAMLKSFGPPVVQDAAHRYLPGEFGDERYLGDYVCHSFQAIKALTTGDGGSLYVPRRDEKLAELLRWYGLDRTSNQSFRCSQTAPVAGFKYHMNDIAAAIGLANVEAAREGVSKNEQNAQGYLEALELFDRTSVRRPWMMPGRRSSWWLFCVLPSDQAGFMRHMDERGIDTSPVHARNDKHPALRGWKWRRLPGVDDFCSREVAIPCGWWLSDHDLARVKEAVLSWPG